MSHKIVSFFSKTILWLHPFTPPFLCLQRPNFCAVISSFISRIISASFVSHSSRLCAYTFRVIFLPFTRGEYRPSHVVSLICEMQPVPGLRRTPLYGSNGANCSLLMRCSSPLASSLHYACTPVTAPIVWSILCAAFFCISSVTWE